MFNSSNIWPCAEAVGALLGPGSCLWGEKEGFGVCGSKSSDACKRGDPPQELWGLSQMREKAIRSRPWRGRVIFLFVFRANVLPYTTG